MRLIRPKQLIPLGIALAVCLPARAQSSPGNWSLTGSMNTARTNHTATLLNNGMVLIVGGNGANGVLASAELYNPATGTFAATGGLNTARALHTATLLNNGMVLIAGGCGTYCVTPTNVLSSAELYNPATGTFTAVGNMTSGRIYHTATALNDGTVLIAGGGATVTGLLTAELYNPATGTFAATGNLNIWRSFHTATLLTNGMVLIATTNQSNVTSAELYNPATQAFTLTGNLNTMRVQPTATLLNNGMVLFAGGTSNTLSSAELYNPATGAFSATITPTSSRVNDTAVLLSNGMVLFSGGYNGTAAGVVPSAEVYDPVAGAFALAGNMSTSRWYHTATLLGNGKVLVAGGLLSGTSTSYSASAELFTPSTLIPTGLSSITVTPGNPSVPVGGGQRFTATGTFTNNSTQTLASAEWSSSNNAVVTLTSDSSNYGDALGAQVGSAAVSACAGSICGSTTMTVTSPPPTPSITSLSPISGTAGTAVTVTGTNFGNSQGTSIISFNGAPAPVTSWSPTNIVVKVPIGATSGNVVVASDGLLSNGKNFTFTPAISLSITSAPVGGLLTITGTGFGGVQGSSSVTFNGTAASATSWTATSIAVTVPAGATTGNVLLIVNGIASNSVLFTVTAPPSISNLSPTSGPAGISVTITGTGFGPPQGTSQVVFTSVNNSFRFRRTYVASVTSWSDTSIVVTEPSNQWRASTTTTVVVRIDGVNSNSVGFTVLAPPSPSIASLNPVSGAAGTVVTITGTGFGPSQGASTVAFNDGQLIATPTSWNYYQIVVPVPLGARTGGIVVTIAGDRLLPVQNPMFEVANPFTGACGSVNCFNTGPIPNWATTGSATGSWQPNANYNLPLPDGGSIVAYSNGGTISQTLTGISLQPYLNYKLSVNVGQRQDQLVSTYSIQLLSGATVLNTLSGSNGTISPGTFADEVLTYATGGSVPAGDLSIALTSGGPQIDFDDVRLSVGSNTIESVSERYFTVIPTTGVPVPPTLLTAVATSSNQVTLNWTGSPTTGVDYTILRNGVPIQTNVTGTSYSDTGLTAATPYTYSVEAVGPQGTSVPSNLASVTTAASSAPNITSTSVMGGPAGSLLTINGINFGSNFGTVQFGSTASAVQIWTTNTIVVTVPTSLLPGPVNIQVVTSAGSSNAVAFVVTIPGCLGN